MAQIEINSFFTRGGAPATNIDNLNPHSDGKNYPRLRIWEVAGNVYNLVVGDTIGTGQNTDGIMAPVVDTAVEDGFYSFIFTDTVGFDQSKKYLIRADGGPSLPSNERYQVAEINPAGALAIAPADIAAIADGVWEEAQADHNTPGTMGGSLDCACTNASLALTIVNTLLKFETNRTKIDKVAKTLTVYDNDDVTPLIVFDLKDGTGVASVQEVCERIPR